VGYEAHLFVVSSSSGVAGDDDTVIGELATMVQWCSVILFLVEKEMRRKGMLWWRRREAEERRKLGFPRGAGDKRREMESTCRGGWALTLTERPHSPHAKGKKTTVTIMGSNLLWHTTFLVLHGYATRL
jgi:hypothetical protein